MMRRLLVLGTLLGGGPLMAWIVIERAPGAVALQSSVNPAVLGQPVTLTATVSPAAATGTVTFFDGVLPIGVATLSGGKASLTTALLASGVRPLRAAYRGDSTYSAGIAVLSQKVATLAQNGFAPIVTNNGVGLPRVVAVGDFNGDGKADIVASAFDSNKVSVLLGKGDGTFQAPAGYLTDTSRPQSAPFGIAVGDFNGDGRADLAVANGAFGIGSIAVLLGNGDGTFRPELSYPVGGYVENIAMADFNGDGAEDLVVNDFGNNNVIVLLGNGD